MGPELVLMIPSAQTVAASAYIDFLPNIQYLKPLGTSRFLKTIQCIDEQGAVVVKLLIKPNVELSVDPYLKRMEEIRSTCANMPSLLPFYSVIDSQRACYFIRPFLRYNLYDRLSTRPFLEDIEKRWVVFQLLNAIMKIHSHHITHGDLKAENILLTSWNWCQITDFATLKPTYIPAKDPSQFTFYFDTAQRHTCYLAPERFVSLDDESISKMNEGTSVTPEMDIFSLGCVIAEIYTEGLPILTLAQMFKYKKGEYHPNLEGIQDQNIRDMVQSMISIEPKERKSAADYLRIYQKKVFPDKFYTFLYPYMLKLANPTGVDHTYKSRSHICDERIDRIYKDFGKISFYLNFKFASDNEKHDKDTIIPMQISLPGYRRHTPQNSTTIFTPSSSPDCSALIPLSMVIYDMRNTSHALYRLKACNMILALAEQLHDEDKLDRCLPYLVYMLDDPSEDVQETALRTITQLLLMVDSISPVNAPLFTEYLNPKFKQFLKRSYSHDKSSHNKNNSYVRATFGSCLPYLALSAKKFADLFSIMVAKRGAFEDPETENGLNFDDKSILSDNYQRLEDSFEEMTIQIMTDPVTDVRIGLLHNILPLCAFFGKDKTNDVILSHLITYLNDKDSQLKLAFVSSIVTISIFVGIVSVELYILPLLTQALTDPSELVVVELIRAFTELVKIGFIRKKYTWDLVNSTVMLLLHPNEMIRSSVLNLIIAIGTNLSTADLYCMLYPLIRPYFKYEITSFDWKSLFLSLYEPIPRSAYNIAKNWAASNDPTLFFLGSSMKKESPHKMSHLKTSVAFDKVQNLEIPLSANDTRQVGRLKSVGFPNSRLWQISALRTYIYKTANRALAEKHTEHATTYQANILPRSIFLDISHETTIAKPKKEIKIHPGDGLVYKSGKDKKRDAILSSNNLVKSKAKLGIPLGIFDAQASTPSVGAFKETATGAITTSSDDQSTGLDVPTGTVTSGEYNINFQNETRTTNQIVTKVKHSYNGTNRYIIKYLNSMKFEPALEDYPEFGSYINTDTTTVKEKGDENKPVPKRSVLIAKLNGHKSSIRIIRASPKGDFFITTDTEGFIKFWNSLLLSSGASGKPFCSISLGSEAMCLEFMNHYNCFALATRDGQIRIYRVDFTSSRSTISPTVALIREYKTPIDNAFPTCMDFTVYNGTTCIVYATLSGKIYFIDIRKMECCLTLFNDAVHGSPSAICGSTDGSWLLIGTKQGLMNLWDLSFKLLIKSVRLHDTKSEIKRIERIEQNVNKNDTFVSMIGGTGESDVTIWNISKMSPTIVLCPFSSSSRIDTYNVQDITEIDSILSNISYGLGTKSFDRSKDKSCVAMNALLNNECVILCATQTGEMVLWNISDIDRSRVIISDPEVQESPNLSLNFNKARVNNRLTLISEIYKDSPFDSKSEDHRPFGAGLNMQLSYNRWEQIKDVAILRYPYNLFICVNQSGSIMIYK